MDKILINRSDAIGDLILTLPMAAWIKLHFPNSRVGFIVRSGNGIIAEICRQVDDVFEIEQGSGMVSSLLSFRKIFKEFSPDVYVDVGGNKWGSAASFLHRVKDRYGLKHKILPYLFLNKGSVQSRSLALMHESEYNLSLLNQLLPDYSHDRLPEIMRELVTGKVELRNEGRDILKNEISSLSLNTEIVVIHPGMMGHSLNWSARNYARLGQLILEKMANASVIFSYTPSDAEYIDTVKQQLSSFENIFKDRLFYLDGQKIGLQNFVKVIASTDYYVGGSTGPTHIAGILGIPYLSIFSPIKTQSAYRWRPLNLGQKYKIIHPDVVCGEDRFCAGRKCPYHDCMSKIEVKEIFEQFSLILGDKQVIQITSKRES
jgi:heptosyltransferase III